MRETIHYIIIIIILKYYYSQIFSNIIAKENPFVTGIGEGPYANVNVPALPFQKKGCGRSTGFKHSGDEEGNAEILVGNNI